MDDETGSTPGGASTETPRPDAATTDGGARRDPHSDGTYHDRDHDALASVLAEADLAFAQDPHDPADPSVFALDGERATDEVFPQSVCSGGPTPDGVICWTRVAPDVFDPDEPLALEVARDPDVDDVVYRGVVDDEAAIRAHDHTVKVDLSGLLESDSTYHYRFVYDGTPSNVGRCRTLPAPDASPESVSFAVLTCQNFSNGYFGAYHHVAEEDVDFVVHVGDFIYESDSGHFKGLGSKPYREHEKDLPSGFARVRTLEDYRYLYRLYKSDRFLREALERHTLIPAWDDHEIANDIHWDYEVDAPRADHPRGDDPEFMTRLTADAMHAWWEYMPARIGYDPDAERLQERFQLWRDFEFGDLVDLVMTDERLFRDPPLDCRLPTRNATAPANEPPGRTMLGEAQLEWFVDTVRDADATWTVWTDEVLTIPFRLGAGRFSLYPVQGGWDGYKREREYLTQQLVEADPQNFVTLTGDMHCYVAGYKQTDYADAWDRLRGKTVDPSERVGVEFMTPPLTSINVVEGLGLTHPVLKRLTEPLLQRLIPFMNPHIEFFDSHNWGYSVVEFTREDCTYRGYAVDKTVDSADAEKDLLVGLRVPEGEVRIEDVTDAVDPS